MEKLILPLGFLVNPRFIISTETPQGLTLCRTLRGPERGQWTRNEEIWSLLVDLLQTDSVIMGKPQPMPMRVRLYKEDSRRYLVHCGEGLQAPLLVVRAAQASASAAFGSQLGFCRADV